MKVYEYARERNVSSKQIVKKLHQMGFTFVKNHLSLVPEKVLDELNAYEFPKIEKNDKKTMAFISMEYGQKEIGKRVRGKIESSKAKRKVVILPKHQVRGELELFCEIKEIGQIYLKKDKKLEYYYIENEHYFNRDLLFGHQDESEMIAFFNLAVIELLKQLDISFDIIHIHNWPLGLFPLMVKDQLKIESHCKIEFSVYGPTYQGIYGEDVLDLFHIDEKHFSVVEHAMSVNLLKAGLVTSTKVDMSKEALYDLKNSYLKAYVYDNM